MKNLFWGIVLIAFGTLFLLDNLGYADMHEVIHNYWPLILIILGISILVRHQPQHYRNNYSTSSETSSELLHQSNVFGDLNVKIASQNFKGGSFSTVFGDCDLDISGAKFAEGNHELRIHSVFGDSLITLPKDAAVSISANATFGDINIFGQRKGGFSSDLHTTTASFESSSHRIKIIISKVFGDVKVQ